MQTVYYDVSELYLLSRGTLRYYGIARVVAELAYELHHLDETVTFVIFDQTSRRFFRIEPDIDPGSGDAPIGLGLPGWTIPDPLGERWRRRNMVRRIAAASARSARRAINLLKVGLNRRLKPVAMTGGCLVSAGTPKVIADYARHLDATGSRTRLHVLLHDCIPLHGFHPRPDPYQLGFRADNQTILRHASHVIANSDFTAADLLAKARQGMLPPIPPLSVVPLAHQCRPAGGPATIALPARPYVMGVGLTFGRKNLDVVLAAQQLLLAKGRTPPLMAVAGANLPHSMAGLQDARYRALRPHVRMIDSPSQSDLIELYRNALATVVPSKLEGWGLPLGESLWLGTPALAALRSSLPEVGRDLAVYFDPDSPEELAAVMERLLDEPDYRRELVRRIVDARPTLRTWRQVAEDVLATVKAS